MKTTNILGISFYNGSVQQVVEALKLGGLLVVPSAPGLVTLQKDDLYFKSVLSADFVIPDSGYMTLLWNLLKKDKIKRISGLEFLKAFFSNREIIGTSEIFLVNPRVTEAKANIDYLRANNFVLKDEMSYISPIYDSRKVEDESLLLTLEERKPKYIIINIGGGIQEKLGSYLKKNLSYKPAIICTGAAIAFLTGHQARIPSWADKLFLGWLFRCLDHPMQFVPRYLKAFRLLTILLKYGNRAPI